MGSSYVEAYPLHTSKPRLPPGVGRSHIGWISFKPNGVILAMAGSTRRNHEGITDIRMSVQPPHHTSE